MLVVLGAEGFVGSAFVRRCRRLGIEHRAVDLAEYETARGTHCRILVNAAGDSAKRRAVSDPLFSFDRNVRDTLRSIGDFPADLYVYLSTVDVYNDPFDPAHTREDAVIDPARLSPYGLFKHLGELCVRAQARRWLIVRLAGMVGPGLKKNAIYDLTHGGRLYVHPRSAYQYLHTDVVADLVLRLADGGAAGEIWNACGDGLVVLADVQTWLGQPAAECDAPCERYEISIEKLKARLPVPTSESAVRRYLAEA